MNYYVYVLQSIKTKRYYIGCTNNIERRLKEHNNNKTKSLRKQGPFKIIYYERYSSLLEARRSLRFIPGQVLSALKIFLIFFKLRAALSY